MNNYTLKIKALINDKRLPQKELAKKIGKTEHTIANYLAEKTKIDIDTLVKIAQALEVPVSYFFEETGDRGSNTGTKAGNCEQKLSELHEKYIALSEKHELAKGELMIFRMLFGKIEEQEGYDDLIKDLKGLI